MTQSAEPSGIHDPIALARVAKARADKAAVDAAAIFSAAELSPPERQLALQHLIILELANDAQDFHQFIANLDVAYKLIRYTAEVTRPAIEAAIAARKA